MLNSDKYDWDRFCAGDQSGLERIYQRHKTKIMTYCFFVTGDQMQSEDIVQETFSALLKQSGNSKQLRSIKNWLFICARNFALNYVKQQTKISYSEALLEQSVLPNMEIKLFLNNVLANLSDDERDLVLMREQSGFSIREIAEILDTPEGNVRIRLYRARKKMQQIVKGEI